jgi:hypothetical protein
MALIGRMGKGIRKVWYVHGWLWAEEGSAEAATTD